MSHFQSNLHASLPEFQRFPRTQEFQFFTWFDSFKIEWRIGFSALRCSGVAKLVIDFYYRKPNERDEYKMENVNGE